MFDNLDDPKRMFLLALGAQIAASRGNLGQAVGQGLLGGMQAYQSGKALNDKSAEEAQQRKLRDLGLLKAERDLQEEQDTKAAGARAFAEPKTMQPDPYEYDQMGAQTPQPAPFSTPGGGGLPQFARDLMQINPIKAAAFQQSLAKDTPFGKIDPEKFTPDSLKAFMTAGGRDFSLLRPRSKMEVSGGAVFDPYNASAGSFVTGPESDVIPDPQRPGQWIPNPAKVALKRAGATNVTTNMPPLERREQGDMGALYVKNFGDLQAAARSARNENSILTAMEKNPIDTSRSAPLTATAASWLASAGLGGERAKEIASNSQKFQGAAMELVLQKQLAQKGPQTESDAKRLEATVASLGNTKEANAAIIAFSKAANNRTLEQERFYNEWWKKNKTLQGADVAWLSGGGSRSIWDDPTLKRYAGSKNDGWSATPVVN